MTYNFDEQIDRRGTNSCKWDEAAPGELPMWVADMDFKAAPPIIDAVSRRVAHGVFGYTHVPERYYASLISWFSRRHGFDIQRQWIITVPGVVPAISATIKAMTKPGDGVIVQTPVYNCFFSSIRNNGCTPLCSNLVAEDGTYRPDYADLERKAADPRARLFILCNPHNPAGRVWTAEELRRMGEICLRHGVFVIADEIHCELVAPGHTYTPFATLSPDFLSRSATCTSPSKAFNIAGLQIANIAVADGDVRRRIDRAVNDNEVCDVNPLGVEALIAAYDECGDWLDQLNAYLHANYLHMIDFCESHLPQFPIATLEGTYLVWMDCRILGIPSERLGQRLRQEAKLWLNDGTMYGPGGEGFMRWNIACPRLTLDEGLRRFHSFVSNFLASAKGKGE